LLIAKIKYFKKIEANVKNLVVFSKNSTSNVGRDSIIGPDGSINVTLLNKTVK